MPVRAHRFPFDRRCRMARLSHHLPGLMDVGREEQMFEARAVRALLFASKVLA